MFLARYARQSLFIWEERDVIELNEATDDLIELLQMENKNGHNEEFRGG